MSVTLRHSAKPRARPAQTNDYALEVEEYADMLGMDLADFFYPFSDFIVFEDTPGEESVEVTPVPPRLSTPPVDPERVHSPTMLGPPRNPRPSMRSRKSWRLLSRLIERERTAARVEPCRRVALALTAEKRPTCSMCYNEYCIHRAIVASAEADAGPRQAILQRWRSGGYRHRTPSLSPDFLPLLKPCLKKPTHHTEAADKDATSQQKGTALTRRNPVRWRPVADVVTIESENPTAENPVEMSTANLLEEPTPWPAKHLTDHFGLQLRSEPGFSKWLSSMMCVKVKHFRPLNTR